MVNIGVKLLMLCRKKYFPVQNQIFYILLLTIFKKYYCWFKGVIESGDKKTSPKRIEKNVNKNRRAL